MLVSRQRHIPFTPNWPSKGYNLALSDWFHAPVIHEVSRQAGRIRVNATDNVQVAKVLITILNAHGQTLKQGEAAQIIDTWWEFETAILMEEGLLLKPLIWQAIVPGWK